MRRPLLILAALVVVVAIMAIRLAPASIADVRLAQITDGGVRLNDTEGTVWDARGILAAGTARIPVAWRIDAWPLVRGEFRIHLAPSTGTVAGSSRAEMAIRGERLTLRDVQMTLPVDVLGAATGIGAAWILGGDLDVNATTLEWAPPSNHGGAQVRWRKARLIYPGGNTSLDLGEVSLVLSAEGDRLSGPVSNDGGDLAIRGDVALRAASGIQVSLVLVPRRADNRELAQALSILGPPEPGGWRLDWRLPLR